MDRNFVPFDVIRPAIVALRKESVDRNLAENFSRPLRGVALRKESVDRNMGVTVLGIQHRVALRKESVDRNVVSAFDVLAVSASLSARRAWIEIPLGCG